MGALTGVNQGTISNVSVSGHLRSYRTYSTLGGIAGENHGIIESSRFGGTAQARSTLRGHGDIGGITGRSMNGTIRDCRIQHVDITHQ